LSDRGKKRRTGIIGKKKDLLYRGDLGAILSGGNEGGTDLSPERVENKTGAEKKTVSFNMDVGEKDTIVWVKKKKKGGVKSLGGSSRSSIRD